MDRELTLPRSLPWHDVAWAALQSLTDRRVHAILLHGARGIGKKSLGFDLAQAVLCERPAAKGRACGLCTGCVLTGAGSHPDFRFVLPDALKALRPGHVDEVDEDTSDGSHEGAGADRRALASREIRIDQIRALGDFAALATHRGGARVILLAPAEALNAAAANSLLKLLEEPPDRTLFVLVSDAVDELPATIRSRCVLVRVEAPAQAQSIRWLEEQGIDDAVAALAAAGGAPLAAVELSPATSLQPDQHDLLLELLERGAELDAAEIARRVPREIPVAPVVAFLQRWCWDLLAYRASGRVRYHLRQQQTIARLARTASDQGLWRWAASLERAQANREHPLNARLVIESILLQYLASMTGSQ